MVWTFDGQEFITDFYHDVNQRQQSDFDGEWCIWSLTCMQVIRGYILSWLKLIIFAFVESCLWRWLDIFLNLYNNFKLLEQSLLKWNYLLYQIYIINTDGVTPHNFRTWVAFVFLQIAPVYFMKLLFININRSILLYQQILRRSTKWHINKMRVQGRSSVSWEIAVDGRYYSQHYFSMLWEYELMFQQIFQKPT